MKSFATYEYFYSYHGQGGGGEREKCIDHLG